MYIRQKRRSASSLRRHTASVLPSGFSPLANAAIWLDPSDEQTLVTDAGVATWLNKADTSLLAEVSQAVAAKQPTQTTLSNGTPGLAFNAVASQALAGYFSSPVNMPVSVFVVSELTAYTSFPDIVSVGPSATAISEIKFASAEPSSVQMYAGLGVTSSQLVADNEPHVIAAIFNGLESHLYADGLWIAEGNDGANTAWDGLSLASRRGSALFLDGKVGHVVFCRSAISHNERRLMEQHLGAVSDLVTHTLSEYAGHRSLIVHGQSNAVAATGVNLDAGTLGWGLTTWKNAAVAFAHGRGNGSSSPTADEQWIGAVGAHVGRSMLDSGELRQCVFNRAVGARAIAFFLPGSGSGNYEDLVTRVQLSGTSPRELIWVQGEQDAADGTSQAQYESRFDTLRAALRSDIPSLQLFLIVKTSDPAGGYSGSEVRAAQNSRAAAYSDVQLIDMDDVQANPLYYDGTHYTYLGYKTVAARCYDAITASRAA